MAAEQARVHGNVARVEALQVVGVETAYGEIRRLRDHRIDARPKKPETSMLLLICIIG
jgi:hypothetical protein